MNRIALKTALVLLVAGLLSACGFFAVVGGSPRYYYPSALKYQKQGQLGNTDYEQRKEDMIECGVPRELYNDHLSGVFSRNMEEKNIEIIIARGDKFDQCMKDKGYIILSGKECGPVKENRGICK